MKEERQRIAYPIPKTVYEVLRRIETAGRQAYVVGGAVRDILMQKDPSDYDITTSATPSEIMEIFGQEHCHPTGLEHGTVTVVLDGVPMEVTTFRIDGDYQDFRHPDDVVFTRSLEEDVKRRDFTINSLAMDKDGEIVDYCGGIEDIRAKVIRTVGSADRRFGEDALRILRGLRFASETGFRIEEDTAEQIHKQSGSLSLLSAERIWKELTRFLCGENCVKVLREFADVFAVVIPEIRPMFGFEQHNPHHIYDVWEHTLVAMDHTQQDLIPRLTMLLHDIGKPSCFTMDEKGVGHFMGHQKISAEMAETILKRLKSDTATRETVVELVRVHDITLEPRLKIVRRRLAQYGEANLRYLIEIKNADMHAHSELSAYRFAELREFESLLDQTIQMNLCCSYQTLEISGKDLIEIGIEPGQTLGRIKKQLLDEVIDEEIPNEKQALLARASEIAGSVNGSDILQQ